MDQLDKADPVPYKLQPEHQFLVATPLPFKEFILMIPVSKSSWTDKHPIDETGFSPDRKLSIPPKQWINYIMTDLRKK
ncbi:hypothetical protein BFS30_20810 [Pedobacter steynii]|uniref:Uncharacterized protein n=1 Tax=Pedobacter steynii TaxID=430522 RepID=A0A1D7QL44_9SPHI|nr:hypothetical protein BFS30_20810 [Pedobacter steynii]